MAHVPLILILAVGSALVHLERLALVVSVPVVSVAPALPEKSTMVEYAAPLVQLVLLVDLVILPVIVEFLAIVKRAKHVKAIFVIVLLLKF